jgi:hypothetical protein
MAQSMQELPALKDRRRTNAEGTGLEIKNDPQRVTVSRMKSSYGDELKKQMEENQKRKRKSKERDQDEDIYFLEESFNYQPFGRGGGGAPLRDQYGNMITSLKPFMRGDHHRMHFKDYTKGGSRGSSRKSGRHSQAPKSTYKSPKRDRRRVQNDEQESDDMFEPDTIAMGPINNTTADTAAKVASDQFFRPDYVVDYSKKQKKVPKMPHHYDMPEAPPPQPQITYQIVQPQVDWAAWRNELFALLQWERWQREEEEKRRKYQWMNEEEQ